jgi:hypothetical protein
VNNMDTSHAPHLVTSDGRGEDGRTPSRGPLLGSSGTFLPVKELVSHG